MPSSAAPSGALPLRLRLLGAFEVEGVDERSLGSRKARVLLRRLAAAQGRPVEVDQLVDILWGGDPPRNPHDQLSVLVSRLRGVLGAERLRRGDAGYWLSADWVDVVEVEARVADAEERLRTGRVDTAHAAAQAALAIARGPFLPEDENAAWVEEPRAAAERLVARARLLAAATALAAGDAAAARSAAAAALDHDPYDEAALRALMRADVMAGRQAAALAAYEVTRGRLADELGVDPDPETRELHLAVLQGRLGRAPTASGRGRQLLGRRDERAALDVALARAAAGAAVAVVVAGDAGMGKTALVRSWTAGLAGTAIVLAGRCDELADALPLQPLVEGLRNHLLTIGRDEAAALLGPEREVLEALVNPPAALAAPPVSTVADSGAGRLDLFDALAAALRRAAGVLPLVLVVDDLHAAAPGTAEFLDHLVGRSARLVVVATRRPADGPDLAGAEHITLGPLGLADAESLVGPERAASVLARSGGHPLFLVELAGASEGELPSSIVEAVRPRVAALGEAEPTVRAAAVLGPAVDVELLAEVTGTPLPALLDHLERASGLRLVSPRGATLEFTHELVREAIEAGTSPARRVVLHRAAARALAARPTADPVAVARHARLADDPGLAADALTRAAALAAERFEMRAAEGLLDEALLLSDTGASRLARGRLRLGRLDLEAARADAERAIELGLGSQAFELAGWVAYYRRDYAAARRYADEGVDRAGDEATRASCLALGGRIRHTRGELAEAGIRLADAVRLAPPSVRGVAQVWHAQLRVHLGDTEGAAELARRGILDPRGGHPFAQLHGRFTLVLALAMSGRWAEALEAVDDIDRLIARRGDRRFPPVSANMRGWLLRGAGLLEEAAELHRAAADAAIGPTFLEPRYAALLDLCEVRLAAGDVGAAAGAVEECADIAGWEGSMSWRHRERHRLVGARLALAAGDHRTAAATAAEVAATAIAAANPRYECRARVLAATADARGGRAVDGDALADAVRRLLPLAGPDGWRELAELASATRSDRWFHEAERLAGAVVAGAASRPDVDADRVARTLRRSLERSRP